MCNDKTDCFLNIIDTSIVNNRLSFQVVRIRYLNRRPEPPRALAAYSSCAELPSEAPVKPAILSYIIDLGIAEGRLSQYNSLYRQKYCIRREVQ